MTNSNNPFVKNKIVKFELKYPKVKAGIQIDIDIM